jgi:hypothetical protein
MQECLIGAALNNNQVIIRQVEQFLENSSHFWVETEAGEWEDEEIDPLYIQTLASIYYQHTDISPEKAMLVERIEYGDNQISASWQFQEKQESCQSPESLN